MATTQTAPPPTSHVAATPPSRPLPTAITAAVTILVLTVVIGNPYFFDHVLARRTANQHLTGGIARTLGAFTWRTHSNPPLLTTALWAGQLIAIVLLAVLTFFFVALLARGVTK